MEKQQNRNDDKETRMVMEKIDDRITNDELDTKRTSAQDKGLWKNGYKQWCTTVMTPPPPPPPPPRVGGRLHEKVEDDARRKIVVNP